MSFTYAWLAVVLFASQSVMAAAPVPHPSERFGALLYQDDFREGLSQWHVEIERPGKVMAQMGVLELDVPGGVTLWFKPQLSGPVAIEFDATAIKARGRNDRGADLNTYWMAGNSDGSAPVFSLKRTGRTADYDLLHGYFVSLGGDNNTRSRFLRYAGERPRTMLEPGHELSTQDALLPANRSVTVTLVASGGRIEYWRNTKRLFEFTDEQPIRQGWFAIRTMQSHLKISRLRIYALEPPR